MSQPLLYLFDIDGTLLAGAATVHRHAFVHAFREVYGLTLSLDGLLSAGRTDSWLLREPLRRCGLSDEQIARGRTEAFAAMEAYVRDHPTDLRHAVLPGVHEVLRGLGSRGKLLGLLTGNLQGIAWVKLQQAGLAAYFETGGFGEESTVRSRLVPVAIQHARRLAGRSIASRETVVVGDTPLDVEAGREAGTLTAALATGRYSLEDLRRTGADLVLPSLAPGNEALDQLAAMTVRS